MFPPHNMMRARCAWIKSQGINRKPFRKFMQKVPRKESKANRISGKGGKKDTSTDTHSKAQEFPVKCQDCIRLDDKLMLYASMGKSLACTIIAALVVMPGYTYSVHFDAKKARQEGEVLASEGARQRERTAILEAEVTRQREQAATLEADLARHMERVGILEAKMSLLAPLTLESGKTSSTATSSTAALANSSSAGKTSSTATSSTAALANSSSAVTTAATSSATPTQHSNRIFFSGVDCSRWLYGSQPLTDYTCLVPPFSCDELTIIIVLSFGFLRCFVLLTEVEVGAS